MVPTLEPFADARTASPPQPYKRVRSRLCQLLDAVMTANRAAPYSAFSQPSGTARSGNYRMAQSLTNLCGQTLPFVVNPLRRALFHPELLPVTAEQVRLLDYGSCVTVFQVLPRHPSPSGETLILKVYRRSLGTSLSDLVGFARHRLTIHRRIADWYHGLSLVLPSQYLVLRGPLLALNAVGCLQPYVPGIQTDPFLDLSPANLVRLLSTQPELLREFRLFSQRTIEIARHENVCVDLVGRNNLALTQDGTVLRLTLLDTGLYEFKGKAVRAPAALAELRKRLAYLEEALAL